MIHIASRLRGVFLVVGHYLPQLTDTPLHHIHYVYGEDQAKFKDMKDKLKSKISLFTQHPEGCKDLVKIVKLNQVCWSLTTTRTSLQTIFVWPTYSQNIPITAIGQSIFPKGKYARSMSTNSHHYLCFYNPRDEVFIKTPLQQAFAENSCYAIESFRDATAKPFKYMLLDLHPTTPRDKRIKANILPDEGYTVLSKQTESSRPAIKTDRVY